MERIGPLRRFERSGIHVGGGESLGFVAHFQHFGVASGYCIDHRPDPGRSGSELPQREFRQNQNSAAVAEVVEQSPGLDAEFVVVTTPDCGCVSIHTQSSRRRHARR